MSRSTTRKMLAIRLKAVNGWRWSIRVTRSSASAISTSLGDTRAADASQVSSVFATASRCVQPSCALPAFPLGREDAREPNSSVIAVQELLALVKGVRAMSASPREVWIRVAPALRQEFRSRTEPHHPGVSFMNTSDLIQPCCHREPPRQHLRAAVESAPSGLESRKSYAVAVRIAAAGKRTRMA